MRPLGFLITAAVLAGGLYATREHWIDKVPTSLATLVGADPAVARSTPDDGAGSGRKGGGRQVPVTTSAAVSGSLPINRTTIGYIRPLASTTMASETVGLIAAIAVKDGASVKAGDLLVRLDDRAAQAAIERDEAALARDQATLDNAKAGLDRIQKLVQTGAGTKQAGDDQDAIVKSAEATVGVDRAALTADRVALSKTELRAPFDGRLGALSVSLGSLVQPGTAIVTLTQMAPVYAEFSVPETDLALVRDAQEAGTLKVIVKPSLAGPDVPPETGPVVFIDNAIDEASANIRVRAQLPNTDAALWPGQSIDVALSAGERGDLVLVPGVAIEPRDAGSIAYVVTPEGKVEVRKVTVALRVGDTAGISQGLTVGEKVVTEGQVDLSNGTAVREVAAGNPDAAAPKAGKAGKPADAAPQATPAEKGGPA